MGCAGKLPIWYWYTKLVFLGDLVGAEIPIKYTNTNFVLVYQTGNGIPNWYFWALCQRSGTTSWKLFFLSQTSNVSIKYVLAVS